MVDNTLVKESLIKLVDKVQDSDPGGASRLQLLADAVVGGPNVDVETWAATDIYKFIDPDSIVEHIRSQYTRAKVLDVLELIRNTLVLGPIIVTWFAISQAVPAYHDLLVKRPDQVQLPFLYFWQQGFNTNFPQILTLGSVALIDAIILASIFILTFISYSLSQSGTNKSEREAQSLRAELVHALAGASLCLRANRSQQPITAGDNLELVARQIEAMMRQTVTQFQTMVDQVLNQFGDMTRQTTTHLETMADQLSTQFGGIAKQMEAQVQEGNKYLGTMTGFAAKLDTLTDAMRSSSQAIEATTDKLSIAINDLAGPARELSQQQKELTDAAKESVTLLHGATTGLTDLSRRQDRWTSDLSDLLDSMNVAVEKAVQFATTVGNVNTQQAAFLKSLQDERAAQGELAKRASDATVGLREALANIDTAGVSLRSMAYDMRDLLDLQRTTDTFTITQGYAVAAQMIEKSANSLNSSAIATFNASQKLTEVAYELESHLSTIK